MKSFAVAALASVVSAWGYQQPIKGHGIGLGYAQTGLGLGKGYGYKGGYNSIGGGQSANALRATLQGGKGKSSDKLIKSFGDHEYGNDD